MCVLTFSAAGGQQGDIVQVSEYVAIDSEVEETRPRVCYNSKTGRPSLSVYLVARRTIQCSHSLLFQTSSAATCVWWL